MPHATWPAALHEKRRGVVVDLAPQRARDRRSAETESAAAIPRLPVLSLHRKCNFLSTCLSSSEKPCWLRGMPKASSQLQLFSPSSLPSSLSRGSTVDVWRVLLLVWTTGLSLPRWSVELDDASGRCWEEQIFYYCQTAEELYSKSFLCAPARSAHKNWLPFLSSFRREIGFAHMDFRCRDFTITIQGTSIIFLNSLIETNDWHIISGGCFSWTELHRGHYTSSVLFMHPLHEDLYYPVLQARW